MKEKIKEAVILPGSYDPITIGHLDIIRQAAEKYEQVYVVAFINPAKKYMHTVDERVKMMILATDDIENCICSFSNGLVIDYMREHGITRIVKGYRNQTDYDYEMVQAKWNLEHGGYETELLVADASIGYVSSTIARERIRNGEDLSDILPKKVIEFLSNR
jgi:pantetheine-phosphate adenylyltransferase